MEIIINKYKAEGIYFKINEKEIPTFNINIDNRNCHTC